MKIQQAVSTYVAFKQSLGMRFVTQARLLKSFSKSIGDVVSAGVDPHLFDGEDAVFGFSGKPGFGGDGRRVDLGQYETCRARDCCDACGGVAHRACRRGGGWTPARAPITGANSSPGRPEPRDASSDARAASQNGESGSMSRGRRSVTR